MTNTKTMPKTMAKKTINTKLNGIELSFETKPSEVVREDLKAHGFRWNSRTGVWYARFTEELDKWTKKFDGKTVPCEVVAEPIVEVKPKTTKAKAKTETVQVLKGEIGDKTVFKTDKGNRRGYLMPIFANGVSMLVGFFKEQGLWYIANAQTGKVYAKSFDKRYLSINGLNASVIKAIA